MRYLAALPLPFLLACLLAPPAAGDLVIPDKHEKDDTAYRRLVLPSGLKVLLVSDPDYNLSAAALDITTGSIYDPPDRQGMAHFLEHMLFLGTKKYPEPDGYFSFLKSHGGAGNGYTAEDHSNYHFQVSHEFLPEALDRFAQFFTAPLFDAKYVNQELKAVDSEYEKNRMEDNWRLEQVLLSLYREGHPGRHFGIGNSRTLAGADDKAVRAFFERHYVAGRMSLCVLGKAPLDTLESLVRASFGALSDRPAPREKLPADYLPKREAFRLARVVPVKDSRRLLIVFPMPETASQLKSRPHETVSFCLGHEGKGSLLSFLMDAGLATSLSAGAGDETADYAALTVDIALTPQGLDRHREVIRACFAYLALLRKDGVPPHVFEEMRTMKRLGEVFSWKGEGTGRAAQLAYNMNHYGLDLAERAPYVMEKRDKEAEGRVLDLLVPGNMLAVLVARGLETDRTEPYYGTPFAYEELEGGYYRSLSEAAPLPGLALPSPNPFLPARAEALSERPVRIVSRPDAELWFSQDTEFRMPHVSLRFHVGLPRESATMENDVLLGFWSACMSEQLRETLYPASGAGLSCWASGGSGEVNVGVDGYDDAAGRALEAVTGRLREIAVSEEKFSAIKDRMVRGIENFPKSPAWEVARTMSSVLRRQDAVMPEEQLEFIRKVTLADVRAFAAGLFRKACVRGLVHGNVTAETACGYLGILQQGLKAEPLPIADRYRPAYLRWKDGDRVFLKRKLETNNSALYRHYHLGPDSSPAVRAAARVLGRFAGQPFFTELRTEQQLGYIVWAVASADRKDHHLFFVIQSAQYPADVLAERAERFIAGLPERLERMPASEFQDLKDAEIERLKDKPHSISERAGWLDSLAFDCDGDFERRADDLAALRALTQADALAALKRALAGATGRRAEVLAFAAQHEPTRPLPEAVDLAAFKRTRIFEP